MNPPDKDRLSDAFREQGTRELLENLMNVAEEWYSDTSDMVFEYLDSYGWLDSLVPPDMVDDNGIPNGIPLDFESSKLDRMMEDWISQEDGDEGLQSDAAFSAGITFRATHGVRVAVMCALSWATGNFRDFGQLDHTYQMVETKNAVAANRVFSSVQCLTPPQGLRGQEPKDFFRSTLGALLPRYRRQKPSSFDKLRSVIHDLALEGPSSCSTIVLGGFRTKNAECRARNKGRHWYPTIERSSKWADKLIAATKDLRASLPDDNAETRRLCLNGLSDPKRLIELLDQPGSGMQEFHEAYKAAVLASGLGPFMVGRELVATLFHPRVSEPDEDGVRSALVLDWESSLALLRYVSGFEVGPTYPTTY